MIRQRNYDRMPCAHIVKWVERRVALPAGDWSFESYPVLCGIEYQEHENTPEADHQFVEDDDND